MRYMLPICFLLVWTQVGQAKAPRSQVVPKKTPVAPTPVAPTPVAPTPVAPTPVAPTPVAPAAAPVTPPAPASGSTAPVAPSAAPAVGGVPKASEPPSWMSQKLANTLKVGMRTGYVAAGTSTANWNASGNVGVAAGYRLSPAVQSLHISMVGQYHAFSVAPSIPIGNGVDDTYTGTVETYGLGVELAVPRLPWNFWTQLFLDLQKASLTVDDSLIVNRKPQKYMAAVELLVGGGWTWRESIEIGPVVGVAVGKLDLWEGGIFLRGSF